MKKTLFSILAGIAVISTANALDQTAEQEACGYIDTALWYVQPNGVGLCIEKDPCNETSLSSNEKEKFCNETSFANYVVDPTAKNSIAQAFCGSSDYKTIDTNTKGKLRIVCNDGKPVTVKIKDVLKEVPNELMKNDRDAVQKRIVDLCISFRQANGLPAQGASSKRCEGIKDSDCVLFKEVAKNFAGFEVEDIKMQGSTCVVEYSEY